VLDAKPNSRQQQFQWCGCANELAWLRANHPDPARATEMPARRPCEGSLKNCSDAEAY